ncbi:MAG: UvrD-helicase domain-containing protein [Actinobacteria bacterium]|nr:UvrD-helicase domain-containing protein [Actinomycetota bacterium]
MTSARFDPTGPLRGGVTTLEASAGTGKTYAIARLVSRFVAEDVAPLARMLVVTFTRAATGELRDRVRARLLQTAGYLERAAGGLAADTDDEVLRHLAEGAPDVLRGRLRRLRAALAEFDAATVTTIHGFCQQVLRSVGMAADLERGATVVEDHERLVDTVVDDVYVRAFHHANGEPPVKRNDLRAVARAVVFNPGTTVVPEATAGGTAGLRARLAEEVRAEVDSRKRAARVVSYDDLLTRLAATLDNPDTGPAAVRRLRAQYEVALIDEFQDTDHLQWRILQRLFGEGPTLYLVGDPKQAIYAFRGADVYAYLEAASAAGHKPSLDVNWRSDGGLLHAYNVLFDGAAVGHPDIRYRPVHPPDHHAEPRLVDAPQPAPLRLRVVSRGEHVRMNPRTIVADSARDHVAADVAAEIVTLLDSGARIAERLAGGTERDRGVASGDVAVLVRTNDQAALVHRMLREAGVPAVINGVGSVFATPAATEWLRLLEALERPTSPGRVRTAALTVFLGWPAERVARAPDERWNDVRGLLAGWAGILRDRGVASLQRTVMLEQGLPERLLAHTGGERLLTDVQHVGELLHAAAAAEDLGPTALSGWLRERMAEAEQGTPAEERARRLETDAEAVQVLTVHRSKGLEFPIVFCPFLWAAGWIDGRVPVFHDECGRRAVDVGGPEAPDFEDHKSDAIREQRGEDLRLLYVALTRARHQAVVWWAPAGNSRHSPLARLLFCRSGNGSARTDCTQAGLPDDETTLRRLGDLAARAGGVIAVETTPTSPSAGRAWSGETAPAGELEAAPFDRGLDHRWRRHSYSSVVAAVAEPRVGSEPDERFVDDERLLAATPAQGAEPTTQERRLRSTSLPLGAMPGGTEVGTFAHAVLEHTDFTAEDLDAELEARLRDRQRRRHVDVGDPTAVVAGLRRAIETPLGPLVDDLRLRDVGRRDRVNELDFELPLLTGAPTAATAPVAAIGELLRAHLPGHDPLAGYADHLEDPALDRQLRGYLTGSLDLVVRIRGHDGTRRFAVIDYKTNYLAAGDEPLRAWHYRPVALADAMRRGHYPLQALLYTVALHRFLRWRLPGPAGAGAYDPDRHLAGVLYLFVRGMTGADTPLVDGRPCGVFAWRPPAALVTAVSDLLDRGRIAA